MDDVMCFRDHNLPGRGFRVYIPDAGGLPETYLSRIWRHPWETEWHVIPKGQEETCTTKKGKAWAIHLLEKASDQ